MSRSTEEFYVLCLCKQLVRNSELSIHAEHCFMQELILKSTVLKISDDPPRNVAGPSEGTDVICIRCNQSMNMGNGPFITFNPTFKPLENIDHRLEITEDMSSRASSCASCSFPESFYAESKSDDSETDLTCSKQSTNYLSNASSCLVEQNHFSSNVVHIEHFNDNESHRRNVAEKEINPSYVGTSTNGQPCSDFHVAVLPKYASRESISFSQEYSMIVQICNNPKETRNTETQSDIVMAEDVGIEVKILTMYPKEVVDLIAQKGSYGSLPEWSPENEAAFQSHERTLVPCDHCGRTFNPDRIEKHESCCIEKPKKREYITPEKDIKR